MSHIDDLVHQIVDLKAENERLKRAIDKYGTEPVSFDWGVLEDIDRMEEQVADYKKHIYEITKILNENPSLLKRGINYQTITKAKAYCKDILRGLKDE